MTKRSLQQVVHLVCRPEAKLVLQTISSDKEDTPTNITVLTSSAKEAPKLKCKYCGKKFSKLTLLEGHIKDYHIPMTQRSGQKET